MGNSPATPIRCILTGVIMDKGTNPMHRMQAYTEIQGLEEEGEGEGEPEAAGAAAVALGATTAAIAAVGSEVGSSS